MKLLRLIPLLLILIDSCVEPFELNQSIFANALVVDGTITNQLSKHPITLRRAVGANVKVDEMPYVTGAQITLFDNEGNVTPYQELAPGFYFASNLIQGVVGRSYYVKIKSEGNEYASHPSTMMPSGKVDEVYGQFQENAINFDDLTRPQHAIKIYFNSRGEPGSAKFRWRWSGIYEVLTYPGLRVKAGPKGTSIPDPLPCSGLIFKNSTLQRIFACECCTCFNPEFSQTVKVSENTFFNTTEFNNVPIATIPYEQTRFYHKYRVKVEQLSLDDEAHEYWRLVQAQQESSSNIFQPSTIRLTGNIVCTTDPDQRVLGLFYATAISEMTYDVPRTLYHKLLDEDTIFMDCRLKYKQSTTVRPPFW
jgi:hypothetical protein